ncbi:MAG TPA: GNAT family N-acetyltransferase [Candidatus Dormibacteraeota bacterium]
MRLAALKEAPHAFGSTYEREAPKGEQEWRGGLVSRTRFLAEVDGEAAGTVSGGSGSMPKEGAITAMWVDPRFRRRGIGELLIRAVLGWLKREGYRTVTLWVAAGNDEAERLYERNGFARTGESSLVSPDEDRLEHEMSREL